MAVRRLTVGEILYYYNHPAPKAALWGFRAMKKIINPVPGWGLTDPERAGGWHHAVIRTGDLIFLSGVIGVYPGTRRLAPTVEEQVRLIFRHLEAGLVAHGATLCDIVQVTLFFTDRKAQWPILDRVRKEFFVKDPPTSTGVGVTELDLGAALEVNAIAVVADGKPDITDLAGTVH